MGGRHSTRRAGKQETRKEATTLLEISPEELFPEYRAYRKCYNALVTTVHGQISDITNSLFGEGLIGDEALDYVRTDGIPNLQKAQKLIDSVGDCVKVTPSHFHDFIAILDGPFNENVVQMLRESYKQEVPAENEEKPQVKPAENEEKPQVKPAQNEEKPQVKPAQNEEMPQVKPAQNEEMPQVKPAQNDSSPSVSESVEREDNSSGDESFHSAAEYQDGFVCPYCERCSFQQFYSKEGCPNKTQSIKNETKSPFPYLSVAGVDEDVLDDLEKRLISDTGEIMQKFSDFSFNIRESLDQSTPLHKLQDCILGSAVLHKDGKVCALDAKHKQKVLDANDLANIFSILRVSNYISFLNYKIIELLVQRYGSAADKQKLDKYLEDFKIFCQRNVFEVPQSAFSSCKSRKTAKVFSIKCTEDTLSLEGVLVIQNEVAKIFGVESSALQLCSVKEGCVELEFVVSAAIFDHIFPLSSSQQSALSDLGVRLLPLEEPTNNMEDTSRIDPLIFQAAYKPTPKPRLRMLPPGPPMPRLRDSHLSALSDLDVRLLPLEDSQRKNEEEGAKPETLLEPSTTEEILLQAPIQSKNPFKLLWKRITRHRRSDSHSSSQNISLKHHTPRYSSRPVLSDSDIVVNVPKSLKTTRRYHSGSHSSSQNISLEYQHEVPRYSSIPMVNVPSPPYSPNPKQMLIHQTPLSRFDYIQRAPM